MLRQASTTCAPTRASSLAVTSPSPLLAPVTITERPAKEGRSAAVQPMGATVTTGYFTATLKPLMTASTSPDCGAAWSASVVTVNCTR